MASPTWNGHEASSEPLSPSSSPPYVNESTCNVPEELDTDVEMSQWQSLTANISPVQPSRRSEVEGFDARSRTSSETSFSLGEYHWTIEASAIILSISSMVVILILLPVYENEPLSSWTLPVSFNVIISVLGSTSRAALAFAISACVSQGKWNWYRKRSDNVMIFDRFEEASRGPWGSLRLLWWTKVRHWTALGALSAVFLVVFEPFLQAVVTFSGEELVLVGTANTTGIGRTQNLRSGSWIKTDFRGILSDEGSTMGAIEFDSVRPNYDFGALSAICEGFSNLSTTDNHKPAFTCSTVNCTWPVYASLAVCSACDDISSHITRFSGNAPLDNDTIFSTSYGFSGRSSGLASYTGYEIKSQNLEMTKPNGLISEWLPYGETRRAELATQSTCNPGKTVSFHHLKTLIISFSMLKVSPSYLNNSQRWESTAVTAKECALYFCTNIYRSVVEQTVLKEAVLGSYSNRNLDSYNIGADLTRSRVLNHVLNHSLYVEDEDLMASGWDRKWRGVISSEEIPAATPMLWDTDLQLLISGEEYLAATGVNQKGDLRFNITRETTYTLLRWFRDEFSRRRNLATKQLIYPIPYSDVTQPPVINALGTSPNLTRTFDNVAASLTKWIRNRSLQTEPFIGESTEWVVRIRVNWEFLILPIGVLLGGCVFCVLSIWETRDLGLPAWRGSSLATLAHGLDMDSRSLLREAGDGANITDRARSLRVRFVDSEGGPELAHGPEKTRVD